VVKFEGCSRFRELVLRLRQAAPDGLAGRILARRTCHVQEVACGQPQGPRSHIGFDD
ncbi:UNVERIFIED_CONTAM: hypothetical protein Sradi_0697300, partial [Sesamum radiatum]